jgi:hypothetical protein
MFEVEKQFRMSKFDATKAGSLAVKNRALPHETEADLGILEGRQEKASRRNADRRLALWRAGEAAAADHVAAVTTCFQLILGEPLIARIERRR